MHRATIAGCYAAWIALGLFATPGAGWGLGKAPADTHSQDIQILPQSATSTPAPVREHYWWNAKTGTTQWDDPNPVHVTEDGHEYYVDSGTGMSTWTKPADLAWVPMNSEEHAREYYYNTITQESVWEKPDSIAWKKIAMTESGHEL